MKTKLLLILLSLSAVCVCAPAGLRAQSPQAIHRRMSERLGAIDALKARQAVGEDNRGFLAIRGEVTPEERQVVDAENRDRAEVYQLIAQQTGASADDVGRARAKKIARDSSTGVLIQDESGRWQASR